MITQTIDIELAKEETLNYVVYRLLSDRFQNPPNGTEISGNSIDEDCNGEDLDFAVTIYPNPVNDILRFYITDESSVNITLYNITGTVILQKRIDIKDYYIEVELSELSAGIYIFEIINDSNERILIQKVIKN